ncbi:mucosal pentraxin-like [Rhinoderma darwinii]|uniref:mucosal pentraxin-like n=1 Tax=Rhinoderma darwinii TaxID=43563 RepID=UPI003F67DCBF
MEKILVWMIHCSLAVSGIIGQTDMNDDVFTFNKISDDSYVRLIPSQNGPFHELSLCLRFKAILKKRLIVFSLATEDVPNSFRIMLFPQSHEQVTLTMSKILPIRLHRANFNEWTGMCVGWSSYTGDVALWVNQDFYQSKNFNKLPVTGVPYIIIGQEQDLYGGGFNELQCFQGDIADINMWNKSLSNEEMIDFINYDNITGNVITWRALKFNARGSVTINTAPCLPID